MQAEEIKDTTFLLRVAIDNLLGAQSLLKNEIFYLDLDNVIGSLERILAELYSCLDNKGK